MGRHHVVAAAVAAVALLAGCGTSSPGTKFHIDTRTSAPPSTAAAPKPHEAALAVSDLPTGWAVDNAPHHVTDLLPPCYLDSLRPGGVRSSATATFAASGQAPFVRESIVELGDIAAAKVAYTRTTRRLDTCTAEKYQIAKQPAAASFAVTSFPPLGDASRTYIATITSGTTSLPFYVAVARVRGDLVGLVYGGGVGTSVAVFEQLAELAFTKIGTS